MMDREYKSPVYDGYDEFDDFTYSFFLRSDDDIPYDDVEAIFDALVENLPMIYSHRDPDSSWMNLDEYAITALSDMYLPYGYTVALDDDAPDDAVLLEDLGSEYVIPLVVTA